LTLFLEEHPFDFGEEFVHSLIETIEFVLGSISHTASYLRLWALSLAHAQLSDVFFQKCMSSGLEDGSAVALIIGFIIFAGITFGVLMCMDLLECFLHTLRLHWVEF
jgi:V-type H+-transporting ATPase subunit a